MYKISVPISLSSIPDSSFEQGLMEYLSYCQAGKISRVFLTNLQETVAKSYGDEMNTEKFSRAIRFFKSHGIEIGVWIEGFGHGSSLPHADDLELKGNYQMQAGVMGEHYAHGYCPLDKNFEKDYLATVKYVAEMNPDLIMIDDDFRLNLRSYYFGCFCPLHLKAYYSLIGEKVPRERLESLIFSGGRNKYRDAYLQLSRKTLTDFAMKVRAAIDSVNPAIRAGVCMVYSTWDLEGTDALELAKAFAGKTKPFLRLIGAPYHNKYVLTDAIENERLQAGWIKQLDDEVEVFAEGDVFPRPRYATPSKLLELFDLALKCDRNFDGNLKYMFDYNQPVDYEPSYMEKHLKYMDIHEQIQSLFADKTGTGVQVFGAMHKIRDWNFPEICEAGIVRRLEQSYRSFTADILSKNSIPTCYAYSGYPVAICGESARSVPIDYLQNGAVLDAAAAKILAERGIDTGLLHTKDKTDFSGEYYIRENRTARGLADCRTQEVACAKSANVLSVFLPDKTPAAYTYENKNGTRFLVFACDFHFSGANENYFNNYYRQNQLIFGIEWVGRKKLPAKCVKTPNLYIMTATDGKKMSVLLLNLFPDEITKPEIKLDKFYRSAKFVHCSGKLEGDVMHLSEIESYGFAAFEVE